MSSLLASLSAPRGFMIAHRIRIAYALFLLPLLYLAVALADGVLHDIHALERELAGSRYGAALRALQDDAQHRRTAAQLTPELAPPLAPLGAAALADALTDIDGRHGAGLGMTPAVGEAQRSLSALTPLPEEEARRIVRELIAVLVDRARLLLDSRHDTYYLVDALYVELPDLVDRLGRAAQLVRGGPVAGMFREALDRERNAIAGLVAALDGTLDAAMEAQTRTGSRRPVILPHLNRMEEIQRLDDAFARAARGELSPAALGQALQSGLAAIGRLRDDGGRVLETLLAQRIEDGWWTLYRHGAITAALFGLGAVFLFVAVERGTLRPIRTITALMRRLAGGDIAAPVTVPTRRDEIGAMFDALAVFKAHAVERVAQERAQRQRQDALVRIAQDYVSARAPLAATMDTITRVAAATLDVDRVSIITEPRVGTPVVLSRWERVAGRHTLDTAPAHPEQVEAFMRLAAGIPQLEARLVVAVDDVACDRQLTDDMRDWLRRRGVRAVIAARIPIPGRPPAYVTFASTRGTRRWSEQEVGFARSIGDLAAFAFHDHAHRQTLAALDLVDEGLHVTDGTGEFVYANRMSRRLAGVEDEGVVPVTHLPMLDPTAGDAGGERTWRDRDGTARDLELVCRTMPDRNVITVVRDVTERRRQERVREALELELRQAGKMEAIGRLAGGVAHDFNNALGTMIGYINFLLEDLPPGSQDREHAQRLMKAADHAKDIVRQILTYARGEATARQVDDLRALLADLGPLLRASLPASTELALELMPGAAPVLMNGSQIHQIVLNLCLNANDALDGRAGRVAIALDRAMPPAPGDLRDPGTARVTGGRVDPESAYVRLRVSDSGAGMDPEVLSRIFEPFFTTKERGRGTGLGLAVVHGIIAAHDGAYVVDSRPGGGTSFSIYLPLDDAGIAPADAAPQDGAIQGTESVLVIDDDADLLEVMARGLERLGYAVVGTENPIDALDSLRADPALWDVVVTDQVMPGMQGLELLTEIKRIRADCPVILCTGFSSDMTEATARARGVDGFFFKPVEPAAIAHRIRALLDRHPVV